MKKITTDSRLHKPIFMYSWILTYDCVVLSTILRQHYLDGKLRNYIFRKGNKIRKLIRPIFFPLLRKIEKRPWQNISGNTLDSITCGLQSRKKWSLDNLHHKITNIDWFIIRQLLFVNITYSIIWRKMILVSM